MWARSYCLTSESTRLRVSQGGLGSGPEKNMLYSASSRLSSDSSRMQIAFDLARRHSYRVNEKPDERQPELPRVRHGPIVNQHLGGVGAPHDLEHLAQPLGVGRQKSRRGSDGRRRFRFRGTRLPRARGRARARTRARSSAGKTSVIENGRGVGPNSASCSSGSSDASSSSVGCSGRSAYGQNRSSGRCFAVDTHDIAELQDCRIAERSTKGDEGFSPLQSFTAILQFCNPAMERILISACLLGERVRYHGGDARIEHPILLALAAMRAASCRSVPKWPAA